MAKNKKSKVTATLFGTETEVRADGYGDGSLLYVREKGGRVDVLRYFPAVDKYGPCRKRVVLATSCDDGAEAAAIAFCKDCVEVFLTCVEG